jgi:hypothetical protein
MDSNRREDHKLNHISVGIRVSFQITVLKVLAGHPKGLASLTDLKRDVGILMMSGLEWTNRTKRIAARAPDLDIFSQSLVIREDEGWQITDAGRTFLALVETPLSMPTASTTRPASIAAIRPLGSPSIRLIGLNRHRKLRRRRAPDRNKTSAVA